MTTTRPPGTTGASRPDGTAGSSAIISAVDVSKVFKRHTHRATSLKELLLRTRKSEAQTFRALTSLNIEIEAGSTVGLIGPNGSGKSTLLKILSGILRPTTGTVTVRGRVASLLELGAGFNGELSGRENIYLNASLLGLSRKETDGHMDAIIEFSELAQFIDEPVKHYSSGMYVRLGFAVAIHVDPDVLLVDEVLAVGDEAFQRKCMAKIVEFQRAGKTILFVSHSMGQVEELCTRALVLNNGVLVDDDEPATAVETLRRILGTESEGVAEHIPDHGFSFGEVYLSTEPDGPPTPDLYSPGTVTVTVELTVDNHWAHQIEQVEVVAMGSHDYPLFRMVADADALPRAEGRWRLQFTIADPPDIYGHVRLAVQVVNAEGRPLANTRSPVAFAFNNGQGPALLPVHYRVGADNAVATTTTARGRKRGQQ